MRKILHPIDSQALLGNLLGTRPRLRFGISAFLVAIAVCLAAGCQQQMAKQPKYLPLEASEFFEDGRSARPLISGTVARGHLRTDNNLFGSKRRPAEEAVRAAGIIGAGGNNFFSSLPLALAQSPYVDTFPFPITTEVLQRGQERFAIFCAVCHGHQGYGDGMIVQRGFTRPPSYHIDRLRAAPVGYFYDVITHGFGSMPDHAAQIAPKDRWAIVAYLRALQLSQYARLSDLPEAERQAAELALEGEHENGK
jgi:mono/diheme cytochrome c family protein